MILGEGLALDRIEVLPTGCVLIRFKCPIIEDAIEVGFTFLRRVIAPGDSYEQEPPEVYQICRETHTPQKVKEYRASLLSPAPIKRLN